MGDDGPVVRRTKLPTYEIDLDNDQALPFPFPSLREDEQAAVQALKDAYEREGIGRVIDILTVAEVENAVMGYMALADQKPGEIPGTDPDRDDRPCHELHVMSVPRESRKRFAIYIRRRLGFPTKAALDAARFTPTVILRGRSRHEVELVMPDMEALGVEAEIVVNEDDPQE